MVLNYVSVPFLLMEGSISPPLRTRWDLGWPSPIEGQAQHEQWLRHKRKSCHERKRRGGGGQKEGLSITKTTHGSTHAAHLALWQGPKSEIRGSL